MKRNNENKTKKINNNIISKPKTTLSSINIEEKKKLNFFKLNSTYNKEQIDYLKKCSLVETRIKNLQKQNEELNKQILLRKKKIEQMNKIKKEKKDMKLILKNIKEESENLLKTQKEKIDKERMDELNRVKSALITLNNKKKELYQICMTEINNNKKKKEELEKKRKKKNKELVKKMKSELEQNKKENKIKNKFSMDEDDKVIINNAKAEVEKLRNKYELLTQQENDYIKKLKESKKLYNLDESLTQNSFQSNNNVNKIKKNNNNINNDYFFDKNKRSISQPEKIENKKKTENKIDLVNINLNDEKKKNQKEKKINKSTNDIFYKNCSNNDKSNNKENISKIVVKKMNRSKSTFQMKIALTLKEREEKKKQLIERIKKKNKSNITKQKGSLINSVSHINVRWKN